MKKIAIIAAMAGELKPLVRGWPREFRNGVAIWRQNRDETDCIAACAGIGMDAARRAFEEIAKDGAIDVVVSAGWAGALREEFAAGRAYPVSEVIDERSGERFSAASRSGPCRLVTTRMVADQAEKRRLAAAHEAGLVDMEAAAIARLAVARGIPFHCIKGVSDGASGRLPDFNRFISMSGQFQRTRFAFFSFLRPWLWPALMRMGANSRKAAQEIRESLLNVLEHSLR